LRALREVHAFSESRTAILLENHGGTSYAELQ
jgi:hypothetical protein